jgi:hypothetical protein
MPELPTPSDNDPSALAITFISSRSRALASAAPPTVSLLVLAVDV